MATRILRDGFLTSFKINACTETAQNLFTRLILVVDDFGRYWGSREIIKSHCYPLDNKPLSEIVSFLDELVTRELIKFYEVDGKPFLLLLNFGQRLRRMRSKFPEPPIGGNPPQSAAECSNRPPESESESESESETNQKGTTPLPPQISNWRNSLPEYQQELESQFKAIPAEWFADQERYHPDLNVKESIDKALNQFWYQKQGWLHKKKSKSETIDLQETLNKALCNKLNQVWKSRRGK